MKYTTPEMKIVRFETEEVIVASAGEPVVTDPITGGGSED